LCGRRFRRHRTRLKSSNSRCVKQRLNCAEMSGAKGTRNPWLWLPNRALNWRKTEIRMHGNTRNDVKTGAEGRYKIVDVPGTWTRAVVGDDHFPKALESLSGAAVDLSRGASNVRARGRARRRHRDAARVAAHRRLPHGRGSGAAVDRCPAGPRACPFDHDANLFDPAQGGGDPPGLGLSRRADAAGHRTARPAPAPGYRPEMLEVLFGSRTT
jgi:hypothetical protein